MAEKHKVEKRYYIVDTSYLDELYQVPGYAASINHTRITNKFEDEFENGASFYLTYPCLFEFASHITHIQNGDTRFAMAKKLTEFIKTIASSMRGNVSESMWTLIPYSDITIMANEIEHWADEHAKQGISYVDSVVISEAKRIKEQYKCFNAIVHIWTMDKDLKAHEPDREPDPFIG